MFSSALTPYKLFRSLGSWRPDSLNNWPDSLNNWPDSLNNWPDSVNNRPDSVNNWPDSLNNWPDSLNNWPDSVNNWPDSLNNWPDLVNNWPDSGHWGTGGPARSNGALGMCGASLDQISAAEHCPRPQAIPCQVSIESYTSSSYIMSSEYWVVHILKLYHVKWVLSRTHPQAISCQVSVESYTSSSNITSSDEYMDSKPTQYCTHPQAIPCQVSTRIA
jgi:hypothetical protein